MKCHPYIVFVCCLIFGGLFNSGQAQQFIGQCQVFFQAKDYPSAKGQCQLAATSNPKNVRAWQLLAASTLALGELDSAATALEQARTLAPNDDETKRLSAQLNFAREDYEAALSDSETVQKISNPNLMIRAQSLDHLERHTEAIEAYKAVLARFPNDDLARVALAERLLETSPQEALAVVERGGSQNPTLMVERGYIQWASGQIETAISTLERAQGLIQRTPTTVETEAKVLSTLTLAYFGSGELGKGSATLQRLTAIHNVMGDLLKTLVPFLLPMLALLLLHLFGESRIEPLSALEFDSGPRSWSVGHIYRLLTLALLGALIASMAYGSLNYQNLLSLWTPLQRTTAIPIFYATFALLLFLMVWQHVRALGWQPKDTLFPESHPEAMSLSVVVGLLWTFATVGYAYFTRMSPAPLNGYYLPLELPQIWLVVPLALLPLTHVFWHGYAWTPLEKRYGKAISIGIVVCLYALVFPLPLPLLLLEGTLLTFLAVYKNKVSCLPPLIARAVLGLGLGLVAFFWLDARVWF
ncbi:MAG: tetratricopeptide repeat protein [Deinococcaceae bacterium]